LLDQRFQQSWDQGIDDVANLLAYSRQLIPAVTLLHQVYEDTRVVDRGLSRSARRLSENGDRSEGKAG